MASGQPITRRTLGDQLGSANKVEDADVLDARQMVIDPRPRKAAVTCRDDYAATPTLLGRPNRPLESFHLAWASCNDRWDSIGLVAACSG